MALIGVDIGGTGMKVVAYDLKGKILASEYREYQYIQKEPGCFELDPQQIWAYAKEILSDVARACKEEILAITTSSMGEAFVCLDENDRILANSIVYLDQRGKELFQEFTDWFRLDMLHDVLGPKITYVQSLHRLRLLKRDVPEVIEKTKRICFFSNFILYMLGAENCCDYSIAMTTSCFNIKKLEWQREFCKWAGIDDGIFPRLVPTGTQIGIIRPSISKELGMNEGVRLVVGPHDHQASIIGTGMYRTGEVFNAIGTLDAMMTFTDRIETAREAYKTSGLLYSLHYLPGIYLIDPGMQYMGGSLLKWFRDHFKTLESYESNQQKRNFYAEYDRRLPNKPTGLIIAGDFAGDPGRGKKGGFICNLALDTTNETIYRAFMEGETYLARTRLEKFRLAGLPVDVVKTVGGGARSDVFMQIRADNFKVPVVTLNCPEPGTLGNMLLGGVAAGVYKNVSEVADNFVKVKKIFYPDPKNIDIYDQQFRKYQSISNALSALE